MQLIINTLWLRDLVAIIYLIQNDTPLEFGLDAHGDENRGNCLNRDFADLLIATILFLPE